LCVGSIYESNLKSALIEPQMMYQCIKRQTGAQNQTLIYIRDQNEAAPNFVST
jgi:hypothetical protein